MGLSFPFFSANRKAYKYLSCFSLHVDILCLLFNSYVNVIVDLRFNKVNVLFCSVLVGAKLAITYILDNAQKRHNSMYEGCSRNTRKSPITLLLHLEFY